MSRLFPIEYPKGPFLAHYLYYYFCKTVTLSFRLKLKNYTWYQLEIFTHCSRHPWECIEIFWCQYSDYYIYWSLLGAAIMIGVLVFQCGRRPVGRRGSVLRGTKGDQFLSHGLSEFMAKWLTTPVLKSAASWFVVPWRVCACARECGVSLRVFWMCGHSTDTP